MPTVNNSFSPFPRFPAARALDARRCRSFVPGGAALVYSALLLSSCGGGGGGGDDFVGAALVSIQATPRRIDPGNRILVRVPVAESHPNGIFLKLRYPEGLKYAPGTSYLEIDRSQIDVGPSFNTKGSDGKVYLVYTFSRSIFGKHNQGDLVLQLEGTAEVADGKIEVDADVDDPATANSAEFKADAPAFSAEEEVSIEVKG